MASAICCISLRAGTVHSAACLTGWVQWSSRASGWSNARFARALHTAASPVPPSLEGQVKIRLGPRLSALYDLTPRVAKGIADLGTDHGMLPLAFVAGSRCQRAIGVDRSAKVLQLARENARSYLNAVEGPVLTENDWATNSRWLFSGNASLDKERSARVPPILELRLGNGLSALRPGEADTVCMAGLGTNVIIDILSKPDLAAVQYLVLQPYDSRPMYLSELRTWLRRRAGFVIEAEDIREVGGRYFVTMRAAASGSNSAGGDDDLLIPELGSHLREACRWDIGMKVVYENYLSHHVQWLADILKIRGESSESGEQGPRMTAQVEGQAELLRALEVESELLKNELDHSKGP